MSLGDILSRLWQLIGSDEQKHLCNVGRKHHEKHLICEIIFKFGTVIQEKMSFKDISHLKLWQPLSSVERNQ